MAKKSGVSCLFLLVGQGRVPVVISMRKREELGLLRNQGGRSKPALLILLTCRRRSEGRKGFGGGLFTKIPEILAKKIAK